MLVAYYTVSVLRASERDSKRGAGSGKLSLPSALSPTSSAAATATTTATATATAAATTATTATASKQQQQQGTSLRRVTFAESPPKSPKSPKSPNRVLLNVALPWVPPSPGYWNNLNSCFVSSLSDDDYQDDQDDERHRVIST